MHCQNCKLDVPRMNFCGNCSAVLFEICPECGQSEPVKREGCFKKAKEEKQKAIQDAKIILEEFIKERAEGMKRKIRVKVSIAAVVEALLFFALFCLPEMLGHVRIKNAWAYADQLLFISAVFIGVLLFDFRIEIKRSVRRGTFKEFKAFYQEQAKLLEHLDYSERVRLGVQ